MAITGALYASKPGSVVTAPVTAVDTLDTDLMDMGYIGDKGIVEHYEDGTTEVKAWQGGAVVRSVISDSKATFSFTMIENKREVVEAYHKGSVMVTDGATGSKIDVRSPTADPRTWVFDVIDGTKHFRIFIESGEITKRDDVTYATSDAIAYPVEVTAYPVDGVVCTKYSDSIAWLPAAP